MSNNHGPPRSTVPAAISAPGMETAYARVQAILDQLGQGAADVTVRLFRMSGGRPLYLGPVMLSPNLYDEVKDGYGGGDYRADVIDGRGKVVTNFPFAIFGLPKVEPVAAVTVSPAPPAPAPPGPPEVFQRILERLERLEHPPAPARDPVDDFVKMATAMQAFTGGQKRDGMLETVTAVLDLQDRIRQSLPGAEREESPVITLAREVGKPVLQLLASQRAADQAPSPDIVQQASPAAPATAASGSMPAAAQVPAPAAPPPLRLVDDVPETADPILKLLVAIPLSARKALRGMAMTNTDPTSASNVALSMLNDSQLGELAEQVKRPEFLDVMLGGIPTWAPYRPWFAEFVAAIRASLQDDEPEAGSGGDAVPTDDSPAEASA